MHRRHPAVAEPAFEAIATGDRFGAHFPPSPLPGVPPASPTPPPAGGSVPGATVPPPGPGGVVPVVVGVVSVVVGVVAVVVGVVSVVVGVVVVFVVLVVVVAPVETVGESGCAHSSRARLPRCVMPSLSLPVRRGSTLGGSALKCCSVLAIAVSVALQFPLAFCAAVLTSSKSFCNGPALAEGIRPLPE